MRRRRRKKTLSRLSRLSQCNACTFYRVVRVMILSDINDNSVFLSFIVGSTRFTLCQLPDHCPFETLTYGLGWS